MILKKQSPRGVTAKTSVEQFHIIHGKLPVLESLFNQKVPVGYSHFPVKCTKFSERLLQKHVNNTEP